MYCRKRIFIRRFYILMLTFGLLGIASHIIAQNNTRRLAILIDIKGGIGPATADFFHRSLKQATEKKAQVIILQLDTPGGLATAMRDIIKDILASPIPVIGYVAPSGAHAASAGTYILYATHIAAMAPGTNLGAATPIAIGTPGGSSPEKGNEKKEGAKKAPAQKTAAEKKAISDARAYIRSLAQLRGRNVEWAESAVVEAESLSAEEAYKIKVINIIASNIPNLLEQANGMKISVRGETQTVNTANLEIEKVEPDWRTRFLSVITDPSVAYILLMIGFYGIFFEFINPGFIVPGVVGAISLLLALYAFQLLPINYAGLALILLGLAFIVAEAFMPSFGMLGIGGGVAFVIGSIMLMRTDAIGFGIPMYLIIAIAIVTIAFFLLVLSMAFRSRGRPIVSGREAVIGKRGVVNVSDKRMWVRIEGERWQCKSDVPLQDGDEVVVERLEGLFCVVKPVEKK
ncbi:serine protease [Coxiella burnetii]|uniref:Non-proteolytic membrane spanning protein, peptidase family S49 n=1 Tax=Coxiella burnetii (strain Dugway 5J108-111) TaxID=434922 RepID=A9KBI9_COXBN|nr:nodulation protein NfeD [Coxiella burnetii]ABS77914.1 non-proteolytic membrane spanning protein, peptidase family S49 [Coxiella burnetii Dugway 5J108-111]OYK80757.1 serine protease [Coxiella burnetii]OYK82845.1 serine protease [Coxiella burnetii]